jgi:isoaspartyl peptidase/L-asparaginase-like protein (Ntn-hydrolase superfamily)
VRVTGAACLGQTVPMTPSSLHVVQEGGDLAGAGLLIHGGAGTFERLQHEGARGRLEIRSRLEDGLRAALTAGWEVLEGGGTALLATVEAVVSLEDSGLFNAGRGSSPTTGGRTETDASIMDGATGAAGAVCAATWPANPVKAALAVANLAHTDPAPEGAGWQPLLLAADGADELARAAGLAPMPSPGTTGPAATDGARSQEHARDLHSHGTVGAVAVDQTGHVAAATSTGGRPDQRPGRVGDSPIIGAGTWADDTTAAVSATGAGEAFILAGFAHRVDWAMRSGLDLDRAVANALAAVTSYRGFGGAIALTASGRFTAVFDTPAMARGWRSGAGAVVRV